jgi:hypothetical protein
LRRFLYIFKLFDIFRIFDFYIWYHKQWRKKETRILSIECASLDTIWILQKCRTKVSKKYHQFYSNVCRNFFVKIFQVFFLLWFRNIRVYDFLQDEEIHLFFLSRFQVTHTQSHTPTFPLSHTHTRTHAHARERPYTLSLSLSHTHTWTHTHILISFPFFLSWVFSLLLGVFYCAQLNKGVYYSVSQPPGRVPVPGLRYLFLTGYRSLEKLKIDLKLPKNQVFLNKKT